MANPPRIKHTSDKVKERIPRIINGLVRGDTVTEIAEREGITRTSIHDNMNTPEFQHQMALIGNAISLNVVDWINQLHDSEDPQDRREAARLSVQLMKAYIPKKTESKSESINFNLEARHIQHQGGIESLPEDKREELKRTLLELDRTQFKVQPEQ